MPNIDALLDRAVNALASRFDQLELRFMRAFDDRMDRIEARIFEAECRIDRCEKLLEQQQIDSIAKEEKIDKLSRQVADLLEKIDDHEQYQRRSNIRISGLPEGDRESTEECEKLVKSFLSRDLEIEGVEISIAHRLGRRRRSEPRPIICRLVRRADKTAILRKRKTLKERKSPVYLSEDLTKKNQRLFRDVRGHSRIKKAWTLDGKVMAEGHNGQRLFNIGSAADIDRLLDRYNRS